MNVTFYPSDFMEGEYSYDCEYQCGYYIRMNISVRY
jgi:hypothetical protein